MTALFALAVVQASPVGGRSSLLPFVFQVVAIFAIFYFVMIRPQQKQRKDHEERLRNLKRGDEVVTSGGIIGKVLHISETAREGGKSEAQRYYATLFIVRGWLHDGAGTQPLG